MINHVNVPYLLLLGLVHHLFENIQTDDNRRPDICINNPYGGGRQIILDVAVTGVTGQSRRTDLDTDQPLDYRYNQDPQIKHALNFTTPNFGIVKFQFVLNLRSH